MQPQIIRLRSSLARCPLSGLEMQLCGAGECYARTLVIFQVSSVGSSLTARVGGRSITRIGLGHVPQIFELVTNLLCLSSTALSERTELP